MLAEAKLVVNLLESWSSHVRPFSSKTCPNQAQVGASRHETYWCVRFQTALQQLDCKQVSSLVIKRAQSMCTTTLATVLVSGGTRK